jgi:hypothetical protein
VDQLGKEVNNKGANNVQKDIQGGISMSGFGGRTVSSIGTTTCPNTMPLTSSELAGLRNVLGSDISSAMMKSAGPGVARLPSIPNDTSSSSSDSNDESVGIS